MAIWPFRAPDHPNTINLHGGLDEGEPVQDVEKQFLIRLSDPDAVRALTMDKLEDLVRNDLGESADENIWQHSRRIARFHSGHEGPIDRDTTFFASHAKGRMKHG